MNSIVQAQVRVRVVAGVMDSFGLWLGLGLGLGFM